MPEPTPLNTQGRDPNWCARMLVRGHLDLEQIDREEAEREALHSAAIAEFQTRRAVAVKDYQTLCRAFGPLVADRKGSLAILVEHFLSRSPGGFRVIRKFAVKLYLSNNEAVVADIDSLEAAEDLRWPVPVPPVIDAASTEAMAASFALPTLDGSPLLFTETFGPIDHGRTILVPSHAALDLVVTDEPAQPIVPSARHPGAESDPY